jgi:hypothetical protein
VAGADPIAVTEKLTRAEHLISGGTIPDTETEIGILASMLAELDAMLDADTDIGTVADTDPTTWPIATEDTEIGTVADTLPQTGWSPTTFTEIGADALPIAITSGRICSATEATEIGTCATTNPLGRVFATNDSPSERLPSGVDPRAISSTTHPNRSSLPRFLGA